VPSPFIHDAPPHWLLWKIHEKQTVINNFLHESQDLPPSEGLIWLLSPNSINLLLLGIAYHQSKLKKL